TGEKSRLNFTGDISALKEMNLLGEGEAKTDEKKIDFSRLAAVSANPITSDADKVRLMPGDEGNVGLSQDNIKVTVETVFYFNASMSPFSPSKQESGAAASNLNLDLMEPVSVSNVTVSGGSLISYFEENKTPPETVSNYTEIITLSFNDGTIKTYFIDNTGNFSNSLATYKDKILDRVTVRNKNTDRTFLISDARFVTKISEGGIQPKNTISKACDSIINFDGVEVKRDKNIINNLVDGVTLTLKSESPEQVTATIDHDYKKIEDATLEWVDSYNKSMEYLHIVTSPTLDHTPLSQRDKDSIKNGVFQAESPVIILMNRLRSIPSAPYKTAYERQLSLLEQVGIYTKKNGSFSLNSEEWNSTKMGLLNIELEKFRSELRSRFNGVEQLFANDTHGDLVKDSGAAVSVNKTLQMSIGAGSFFEERIAFNNNKIKDSNSDIEKMNRDLVTYEQDLREKYGRMNQAMTEAASKEKWLNGQMKSQ
ncbi:MAG: flagellar filament capping protein FliD, partial [Brevinematales bacterium]